MPVRKIPPNYRSVTGSISFRGRKSVRFESTLERDFYEILDFNLNVDDIDVQPVVIEYEDETTRSRHYTPDVLVIYRDDIVPAKYMRPWLCEVKYRDDLRKNWSNYKPKIRAGMKYAKRRGWDFKIMTEREIRTDYLNNVKFLRHFRNIPINESYEELLLTTMRDLRETDPETLLLAVFQDKWNRALLIPTLWRLISVRRIGIDITQPLTMRSRIWVFEPLPR